MPRNSQFQTGREPLQDHAGLQLRRSHVSGPLPFLNPTRARYAPTDTHADAVAVSAPAASTAPIEHLWRSRDNRKGRHALRVDYGVKHDDVEQAVPGSTSSIAAVGRGILRMATYAPYWDVSYLVATIFTLGSVIWIINAFFVWLPLEDAGTEFSGEITLGGGITAFIGATVFEIGSVLLLLEAVNESQTGCFGWALEKELKHAEGVPRAVTGAKADSRLCRHHHANQHNLVGTGPLSRRLSHDISEGYSTSSQDGRTFRWWPSTAELRGHYLHELGFLASLVQFFAATIFWIAGFTGLPGIYDHMSQGLMDGVYWVPQMVGGAGFIISGLLFTLETQRRWYQPAFHVLGWHIGVWNFIGGIGFTLCGALGPGAMLSGVEYQATLATFWGSWAFMIGSTIQWYESLQKFPVEKKRKMNGGQQTVPKIGA